ncbi:MAG: Cysteine desulfurase [Bacteroidetes bacterium ADurb.Bin141]|nr:MAG: Cysteine desulfurase [Bacteroidetes bacterium ADurb.Bin141]
MKVYFDNAATTPLRQEVIDAMLQVMQNQYGNPSSIHSFGREMRSAIEGARKTVAKLLKVSPAEIFFTSGGTESNNMAIRCSVNDHKITHAISSRIEHHAVTHTLEDLEHKGVLKVSWVKLSPQGEVDYDHLEELLKNNPRSLVSLMHANNELGTLNDIDRIGELCKLYNAIFHCDTVQAIGHFLHDLSKTHVDFISCAAHKFHGPKGVGFIYISNRLKISPLITGGAQERNMRGGTENVYGIIGLAKALKLAYHEMEEDKKHITGLKKYMIKKITEEIPGTKFNGNTGDNSLYTVLNVSLPPHQGKEMILFNLDIAGIAASGGSACSSGSEIGSHVLAGIHADPERPAVRFSFSRYNTKEEVDYCVEKLKELFAVNAEVKH